MRILLVHNYYQQSGGEDRVFADEGTLLETHDQSVVRYTVHNDEIAQMSPLRVGKATVWNGGVYLKIQALLRRERPDVVHLHNTFPLISPAAYYAARREGIAVVQTLHNYRLLCPGALFLRDGRVCEDCLGRSVAWPGVLHACYRGNRAATVAVAGMVSTHRALGTWTDQVSIYIALTEFSRQKFIQGGLPPEKIMVKPHFVHPDPVPRRRSGRYALFVGRLSEEKGLHTLLAAWNRHSPQVPLKIVGEGPLASIAGHAAKRLPGVAWLGRMPPAKVSALMGGAFALIVPSECYETFGRVVIEAFAVGTPVIASRIGAIAELVEHGRTGRVFHPGDAADLARQVEWMLAHPAEVEGMRQEARAEYEAKYTGARNYDLLMSIYETAIQTTRAEHANRP